jgi:hypothetical protein
MAARPTLLGVVCFSLVACGSDPGADPSEERDPTIPDYTRSPCYGSTRTTLVYDAETHGTREVAATCRAEGDRTLVYVASDVWEVELAPAVAPITQGDVDAFMFGYEIEGRPTSYRPDLGVLPTDELVFGSLDSDSLPEGKLPIFVVNSGGAGEGYLCGWCPDVELHLDGFLLHSLDTDETLSIAAHETVHAIHRGFDANETVWVDETLAQAAMTVNGFFTDGDWLNDFLHDTNVAWGPGIDDPLEYHYGAGLLFGSYLWERGGQELLQAITSEPLDDWAGIDAALVATGATKSAWEMYLDMALATFLDDPRGDYSFESLDLEGGVVPYAVVTGTTHSDTIQPCGLVFVVFDSNARRVRLDAGQNVSSRLVLDTAPTEVLELVPGEAIDFDRTPRVLLLTAPTTTAISLTIE